MYVLYNKCDIYLLIVTPRVSVMLQLINSLPFPFEDFEKLRKDWTRFQDGLVTLFECPNAIREVFECEASIIQYTETDEVSSTLPTGKGQLILTVT